MSIGTVASVRVTTVMTVYNGATYLREAIDSVLAELDDRDEFIVVDDGSSDDTHDILKAFGARLRVVRQANAGIGAGLNAGIATARGMFLAFNDCDDLWVPGALQQLLGELHAAPGVDGVFGMSEQFVSPELGDGLKASLEPPSRLLVGQVIPCLVIRRESFERAGGFDPAPRFTPFADWLPRSRAAGLTLNTSAILSHRRRLHPANLGRLKPAERDAELRQVLYRHLQRRKAGRSAD